MHNHHNKLTSGRLLAVNTLWNLIGTGLPLIAAFFAIPILIENMGTARFGVLTLAWVLIGYFSLFDLGLGRAVTKLLADKLGTGCYSEIPQIAWTAFFLMLIMGGCSALVLYFLSPWIVNDVLKIPKELTEETLKAFILLSISLPLVISTTGLRGILEAYQLFGLINFVRLPMGLFTFIGPLLVLPLSVSLYVIVAVLLFGRILAWATHLFLCLYYVPILRRKKIKYEMKVIKSLIGFGSWMTASNLIGPIMIYMDRFLIGALVSVTAVAYYATPYEIVTKILIIPSALGRVLFPAFATLLTKDCGLASQLFGRGASYLFLIIFPITVLVVAFADWGLSLWLGKVFALNSVFVLKWLIVGVFLNSTGQVAFGLLLGAGRPDLPAKMYCVQLIFYLPILWCLLILYGYKGAAVAWTGRVAFDTVFLLIMTKRLVPQTAQIVNRHLLFLICALVVIIPFGFDIEATRKTVLLLITFGIYLVVGVKVILMPVDRMVIRKILKTKEI